MLYMINDYIRAYRWGSLKEHIKTNFQMLFFINWCFLSLIGKLIFDESNGMNDFIAISAIYLPMMHAHFSGTLHSIPLSKMMYLCPIDAVERAKYIHHFYCFRVLFHMALSAVGVIMLILFTRCSLISAAEILCTSLTVCLSAAGKTTSQENEEPSSKMALKISILLIALISNTVQLVAVTDDRPPRITLQLVLLGILLFVQLPLSLNYHKCVKRELKAAAYYEGN